MVDEKQINLLLAEARRVREYGFVIHSSHKIGAAVLTATYEIFGGCTIESVISGLGICAERAAIDHAVVNGHYQFIALAVVDEEISFPCGACLQYLLQFYQINELPILIVAADKSGNREERFLSDLLPFGYLSKTCASKLQLYR